MKVVKWQDFSASGIGQKPLFASNLLNILVPDNCARVFSTLSRANGLASGLSWISKSPLSKPRPVNKLGNLLMTSA